MYQLDVKIPEHKIAKFVSGGSVRLNPADFDTDAGKKVKLVFNTLKDLNRLKRNYNSNKSFQVKDGQTDMLDPVSGGSLRGLNNALKAVKDVAKKVEKAAAKVGDQTGIQDAFAGGKLSKQHRKLNKDIKKGLEKAFNVVKKEAKRAYAENKDELRGLAKDLATDGFKYADGQIDKEDLLHNLERKGKKIGYMSGRQALDRTGVVSKDDFNHGQYKKLVPETAIDFTDNDYNPLEAMDPEFNGRGMRRRCGKGLGGTSLLDNPMVQGEDIGARMARVRSFKKGGSIKPL